MSESLPNVHLVEIPSNVSDEGDHKVQVPIEPETDQSEKLEPKAAEKPEIEPQICRTSSKLSGALSRRYFRSLSDPTISTLQGLEALESEEYLFIRHVINENDASDFIDSSHIFEIINVAGEPLFHAVKTFQYENCDRLLELDVSILECEGGGVLSIKGDSVNIFVCTLTFNGDFLEQLGMILNQNDGFMAKQKLVLELQGKVHLEINRNMKGRRGEFEIILKERGISCGRISSDWSDWLDPSSPVPASCFGVGLSNDLDVKAKALLMAAMIFLYFENFDSGGVLRGSFFTLDRICCLIFGILFVLILIFFTIVAILRLMYPEF